jgi:hypothetical protein
MELKGGRNDMNKENNIPEQEINTEAVAEQTTVSEKKNFIQTLVAAIFDKKAARSADVQRRLRRGRAATAITVGVVILVLLLNVVFGILGDRFPLTIDLSSDGTFTLSADSVKLAQGIENPIEIVVFSSEETFSNTQSNASISFSQGYPQVATALTQFYNATKLYNTYSDGKVTTTFIDMNRNPAAVNQYTQYTNGETIQAGDILFISGKKCKTSDISTGLFTMDASTYAFESIVEQTLATKINAVQSETNKVLTFLTGHGESADVIQGLSQIYELNGYDIEQIDLSKSVDIHKDSVCAIIPAPTVDYTEKDMERLRKWLDNDGKEGRNLLVITDATAQCNNLYEFLKVDYGMEVTDNIVTETDMNRMYAYTPYYAYADIIESEFTENSAGSVKALTWNTRQIIPHWEPKSDTATQYYVNVLTYSNKAQITPAANFSQSQNPEAKEYEGTICGMAIAVKDGFQTALQQETSTRVAVCGSAYSAFPAFLSMQTVENEDLYLDTMAGMTGVENTIQISSKPLEAETVSFSTTTQIFIGLLLFTIALPIGLLVCGLVVFLKRRHL